MAFPRTFTIRRTSSPSKGRAVPVTARRPEQRPLPLLPDAGRIHGSTWASDLWCGGNSWSFPPFSWTRNRFDERPGYFFPGDFSHTADPSRPAALIVPLSTLPPKAITFTLGDSMSVAEQAEPRVYSLDEIVKLFATGDAIAGFGLSDKGGFQGRFIEVQVWEHSPVSVRASHIGRP